MADLSILEFIIYSIIGYGPLIFLMGYILVNKPASSSDSIMRVVYVMPGIVGVLMLASVGGFDVILETEGVETISIINGTSGVPITNSTITHSPTTFTLQNPVWITFNGMIFILYFLYIIINVINLIRLKD